MSGGCGGRDVDPSVPLPCRIRRHKIDEYLRGLRCVLWPDASFDLTDEKERAEAVAFIEQLLEALR